VRSAIKLLDPSFLPSLSSKASNGNAHWKIQGTLGKLSYAFIAMQPHTYIRPHQHPTSFLFGPSGNQFFVILDGAVALILIDPKTGIMRRSLLSASRGARALEVPAGSYHCCAALSPNTLVLEIYERESKKKYLKGSPRHGTYEAKQLVKLWANSTKSSFKSPLLTSGDL
jgi:cupin fold WbuC family metalloprotein